MPPAGFEPTVSASEQSQSHALDHVATGVSIYTILPNRNSFVYLLCNSAHRVQPNAELDHNRVVAP